MLWLRTTRLILVLPVLLAVLLPAWMAGQDTPTEYPEDAPLGDVARILRKKAPPSQDVIDDDNLTKVMEQAESRHAPGSALRFLMAGEEKGFKVSAPDVTCSLAFTANVKSRFRFVFEPFWYIYILLLLDVLVFAARKVFARDSAQPLKPAPRAA